jgi:hypothetical protein
MKNLFILLSCFLLSSTAVAQTVGSTKTEQYKASFETKIDIRQYLVNRYGTKIAGGSKWDDNKHIGVGWNSTSHWFICEKSSKKEYFYEDLKHFFIKEKVNDEIVEYVECIKEDARIEIGKIYKIQKEKGFLFDTVKEPVYYINNFSYYKTYFKPSTKEAYDLQNKLKEMDKKEEGFCIKLESQKHLDEIIEFYKEKGYKEYGDSHTYEKNWVVFINPNKKIWQTHINNTKYPVKTFEKTYEYEVVHCMTDNEWNFVQKKLNGINRCNWCDSYKEKGHCYNLKDNAHDDIIFYQKQNSKIYTFKEYCDKFGYTPDFIEKEKWIPQIGEWVVALETIGDLITKNKIYQLKKVDPFGFYHLCDDGTTNGYDSSKYRLAFPHEIPNNQQDNQTIDIGDTVSTVDGEGIVIGITTSNKYLVKGAYKFHNGKGNTLIKGNFSDNWKRQLKNSDILIHFASAGVYNKNLSYE